MKKYYLIMYCVLLMVFKMEAQQGFNSITNLSPVLVTASTGDKPQAKVWAYDGKHWAVLANSSGTHLWRLDGSEWTNILQISSKTYSKADTKVVGNIVHIFLFQGIASQLVSVEYSPVLGVYQVWSERTSTVSLNLPSTVEIGTIDMDGNGRMWLAYDGFTEIYVSWSDAPYQNWSAPITVATGISTDDIGVIIALPGKIGIFWSNQNTKRFGFKTHADGANPSSWSGDEVPASQSALEVGNGMADDHFNMAVSMNGTLYCAVKTSYDTGIDTGIALLVRRPNGNWDNLYEVSRQGTRPIVILNESLNKVRVVYSQITGDGDIVYNESSATNISFGDHMGLITGSFNNATSIKGNFTSEVVILASNSTQAVGVLATDVPIPSPPAEPLLSSPENLYTNLSGSPTLSWLTTYGAISYRLQVSVSSNFLTTVFNQGGITGTSATVIGLDNSRVYFWRVQGTNPVGNSDWSTIRSFTTLPIQAGTLVAHWKMDEGSGTSLLDASNYGNNAKTSGNPTWIPGVNGKALRFNGTSQTATAPDNASFDITGAITIAAWIRPEKTSTQYIIKKAEIDVLDGYEFSLSNSGKVFFRFNQNKSGNEYRIDSKTNYPKDGMTWMHVAATFDGSKMKIYINGVENNAKTFSTSPAMMINGLTMAIGAGNNGDRGFQGAMDDTRIYNTALSASEIFELTSFPAPVITDPIVLDPPIQENFQRDFVAYPNPFTTRTSVSFYFPQAEVYSITLYDGKGVRVNQPGHGVAKAGVWATFEVDGSWLASGIYLLRLQTARGTVKTIRLLRM